MRLTPPLAMVFAMALATMVSCMSTKNTVQELSARTKPKETVTVHPKEIDEILYNPGMGIADFHFGFDHPPAPGEYPRSTVAYFRWSWADLEPEEGRYAFDFVDRIIAQARTRGETLGFRIMTEYGNGSPAWLIKKGVKSVKLTGGIFPDYNNPAFLDYHERLIKAFGARYASSPDIDHVDIGSVGCWGEWNTACCIGDQVPQCKQLYPTVENQRRITDAYFEAFRGTPLVMLRGGQLRYAVSKGAGWRGDCFGDYGYFTSTWNHMDDAYTPVLKDPVIADAWKHGPVQFEVCGVVQNWYDKGFDLDLILEKGLEWHVSVLNAKSSPIPREWRPRFNEFLKKLGYRMVLHELTHPARGSPGEELLLRSRWDNVGVAPIYHSWPLAYRLRSMTNEIVAQWTSHADLKHWLPGVRHTVEDLVVLPQGLVEGRYALEVAILNQAGQSAYVNLAIEGKRPDGWYPISILIVSR